MIDKIRIQQVIVVEGKYDAAALSSLVDGLIITTDGFSIFKDKQTQALLKELGKKRGIILLTDPDAAGFRIRNFVSNIVGQQYIRQAYVPAVKGKERRKEEPGKEGLLGVEGISAEILKKAILDCGAIETPQRTGRSITYADLYQWGFSGTENCKNQRYQLLEQLGLPPRLSKKALLDVLNSLHTYEEIEKMRCD